MNNFGLLYYWYKKLKYFGLKYYCPVCSSYLKNFLPGGKKNNVASKLGIVGAGYRLTKSCPVCWSIDRERLLYCYFNEFNLLDKCYKVLHFAPEIKLKEFIERNCEGEYITADLYDQTVMEKIDVSKIPYQDDTFDLIICNHVLEHVPDDKAAVSEIFRTLKREGVAILQVPIGRFLNQTLYDDKLNSKEQREVLYGQDDHLRVYAESDYLKLLDSTGFEVNTFLWELHEVFSSKGKRYGLVEGETIYIAEKP